MQSLPWIMLTAVGLAGCAGSHVGIANAPDAKEINLGDESVFVSKAGGVWEATYRDYLVKFIYVDQRGLMQRKLGLIAAIESASRCKVIDSTLDQMGISIVATVSCPSAPVSDPKPPDSRNNNFQESSRPTQGQDTLQAEKYMREQKCIPARGAALLAKGPGYETYTGQCTSGDTIVVRCEFGNCRSLK